MAVLTVATCQFPVGADISANLRYVKRQMAMASRRGARVAHFPEGALSGYAGTDFETFSGFDWDRLHDATAEVQEHARQLRVWAVLGSAHRLGGLNNREYKKRGAHGRWAGQGSDTLAGPVLDYSPLRQDDTDSVVALAGGDTSVGCGSMAVAP